MEPVLCADTAWLRVHTGYSGSVSAVVEEEAATRYGHWTGDGFLKCTTPYGVFMVHVSWIVPLPDTGEEFGYCNAAVSPAKGALTPGTVVYYVRFQSNLLLSRPSNANNSRTSQLLTV